MFLLSPAWTEQLSVEEPCPHARGWAPTDQELKQILSDHQTWLKSDRSGPGRANLCNAHLNLEVLNGVDLSFAILNNVGLRGAKLNNADLSYTELIGADLVIAELNGIDLTGARLINAKMGFAKLK
jgi:uncharacterized protein YjbI with pentapeptide repeats